VRTTRRQRWGCWVEGWILHEGDDAHHGTQSLSVMGKTQGSYAPLKDGPGRYPEVYKEEIEVRERR